MLTHGYRGDIAPYQALPQAGAWLQNLILGELATYLSVFAIAGLGIAMLTGYVPLRSGIRAVLGAFIVFGAPGIATGLLSLADSERSGILVPSPAPPLPDQFRRQDPVKVNDPYAGVRIDYNQ